MAIETRREKIIFLGIVPVLGAAAGAIVARLLQGSSCPNSLDLVAIMKSANLSGPEKLKALEIYQEVADRPWSAFSTFLSLLFFVAGSLALAASDWIRRRP
jgi:hypothetical protein